MPDQITVTGSTGPTVVNTAKVFSGVKGVNVQLDRQVVSLTQANGTVLDFDLNPIATVTYTIASHVATIALS